MVKAVHYKSDSELLLALRQGAPSAFELLYHKYYRMVAKQAANAGRTGADAEDLFQELLVILVRKIRQPEFQLSAKLSTYLFAIARNLLYKQSGPDTLSRSADTILPERPSENEADELAVRAQREEQLTAVVDQLELLQTDCRQVLKLFFFEKRSQVEIAGILGYSESFVKVKKFRCLDYLRKQVKASPLFQRFQNDNA